MFVSGTSIESVLSKFIIDLECEELNEQTKGSSKFGNGKKERVNVQA